MSAHGSRFSRTKDKTERARQLRTQVSKTEFKLWPYLRGSQTGVKFRRQHPVGPYFIDYYAPAIPLAIEVDGDLHCQRHDNRRDHELLRLGIETYRVPVSYIDENIDAVMCSVRTVIDRRLLAIGLALKS